MLSQKSIIGSSGFIHGAHGGHGSSEFKRNLNGIYTDFIELLRKKSLGEIFFKMLLTQEIYPITWELKSSNKNPKQNALEFLAFGENFIMDRLTARNLKQNLENNLYSSFATEGID